MDEPSITNSQTKRITLFVVTVGAFLTPFDASSVNVALPSIGREFSMDAISLGWVAMAYILTSAMFLLPFGRTADIRGRKRIFTAGIVLFTLASLSMVLSRSTAMFLCFRILQGIGAAMMFSTGIALLTSVFPAEERGKALGINVAAVYFGLSIGPFLGGFLTLHFGWRSIFFVNVPLGLMLVALISLKLKGEWAEAKGERFDWIGSVIYCLGLTAIMYGFSSFSSLPALLGTGLILLGGSGILVFLKWEVKVGNPILNITLFKNNRVFTFSNMAALISYSATYAVTFFLSLYLQYLRKLSPQNAGLILVCQPLVQAIGSPFAGRLSDRMEPRIIASTGMGLTAMGLFLLTFLGTNTALKLIMGDLALLGLGFALFSSPNIYAIMSSVEKRFYGVASGIQATMRLTGQTFSMGVTVFLMAIYVGHTALTPESYPLFLKSMRYAFLFFGSLCSAGIFASLSRGKLR